MWRPLTVKTLVIADLYFESRSKTRHNIGSRTLTSHVSSYQLNILDEINENFGEQFIFMDLIYRLCMIFMRQTACLVVNPITVGNFAFLFNCTPVDRTSDSMMVPT